MDKTLDEVVKELSGALVAYQKAFLSNQESNFELIQAITNIVASHDERLKRLEHPSSK